MNSCQTPTDQELFWENIYNFKEICEAIVNENSAVSLALFKQRVKFLIALNNNNPLSTELAKILLTSLNRSLYSFFLHFFGISFSKCCYQNRVHLYTINSTVSLFQAGERIIFSYTQAIGQNKMNFSHVEKACSFIQAHLCENLTLERVSSEIYVSKCYLCHLFKSFVGTTFNNYVKQQRILRARTLLLSTPQTINEVAEASGFNSSTYFTTVFKQIMGQTPSAFREALKSPATGLYIQPESLIF